MDPIIDAILAAEGKPSADPEDRGGRTAFGISETSNPEAWADGKVTEDEARAIYTKKYVDGPGFSKVENTKLRHFLVDFGVNSGPVIAVKCLQEALHVPVDGVMGPQTLEALALRDPLNLLTDLVKKRIVLLCRICQKNPTQTKFLVGWVNRVLEFL